MWVYCRGMWVYCTGTWVYCTGMWVYCTGMWVYCTGMWAYCTGMWVYCTGMWVYCTGMLSIKVGFCLFGLLCFFVFFFAFFCNYLFFLYEQTVHIYCSKILAQLILANYLKHVVVPVKEVISLLWSVIPAFWLLK